MPPLILIVSVLVPPVIVLLAPEVTVKTSKPDEPPVTVLVPPVNVILSAPVPPVTVVVPPLKEIVSTPPPPTTVSQ